MTYSEKFLSQIRQITEQINLDSIERAVALLRSVRNDGGRLFLLGSGGGAGHASHATCDFRKLCNIESYCPTDNVSELTARINDDGWNSSLENYLRVSNIGPKDCLLVFSVGGGDESKNISANLVGAMKYAKSVGTRIVGIVGRDGGYTSKAADVCILIPMVDKESVTPQTEGMQAVVWHMLVSHPSLSQNVAKWESTVR